MYTYIKMYNKIAFIWMVHTKNRLNGFLLTLYVFSQIKNINCIDLWVAASIEYLVTEMIQIYNI